MRKGTKRAAALSAAVLGVALVGTGCESTKEKGHEVASSASSAASSAASAASSVVSSAINAPSTTTMAGKDGTQFTVSGPILEKYETLTQAQKDDLAEPKGEMKETPDGGHYQEFEGGVIIHKTASYVVWGAIRDKWNELGGSQGELGYPTSDETDTADGGKQSTFEHGTITWKPGGEAVVTKS